MPGMLEIEKTQQFIPETKVDSGPMVEILGKFSEFSQVKTVFTPDGSRLPTRN